MPKDTEYGYELKLNNSLILNYLFITNRFFIYIILNR